MRVNVATGDPRATAGRVPAGLEFPQVLDFTAERWRRPPQDVGTACRAQGEGCSARNVDSLIKLIVSRLTY
jgi:hypothetical protein